MPPLSRCAECGSVYERYGRRDGRRPRKGIDLCDRCSVAAEERWDLADTIGRLLEDREGGLSREQRVALDDFRNDEIDVQALSNRLDARLIALAFDAKDSHL